MEAEVHVAPDDGESEEARSASKSKGPDAGRIIGKRGAVLEAIQYLTTRVAHRPGEARKHVSVDAEGYRARHEDQLAEMARRLGARVAKEGKVITFDPMSARDRRVVHMALQRHRQACAPSRAAKVPTAACRSFRRRRRAARRRRPRLDDLHEPRRHDARQRAPSICCAGSSIADEKHHAPIISRRPSRERRRARFAESRASLTWIGHATFALRLGGKMIVTDPIWSTRVGTAETSRRRRASRSRRCRASTS